MYYQLCQGRATVVVVVCSCSVSSDRSLSNGHIVSNVSSGVSDISIVSNVSIVGNVSIVRSLSSVSNVSIVCNIKKKVIL